MPSNSRDGELAHLSTATRRWAVAAADHGNPCPAATPGICETGRQRSSRGGAWLSYSRPYHSILAYGGRERWRAGRSGDSIAAYTAEPGGSQWGGRRARRKNPHPRNALNLELPPPASLAFENRAGVGGLLHVTKRLSAWLILRFHWAIDGPSSPFPRYSFAQEESLGSGCYFYRLGVEIIATGCSCMYFPDAACRQMEKEAQRSGEGRIIGACCRRMSNAC